MYKLCGLASRPLAVRVAFLVSVQITDSLSPSLFSRFPSMGL